MNFWGNVLGGFFWRNFLREIFWEDFSDEDFFGRIFWEEYFGRNDLVEISINQQGIDVFVKIVG